MEEFHKISALINIQKFFYELLKKSELHQIIQIYTQIPKNSSFPFVYIGHFKMDYFPVGGIDILDINQQVEIYARENDNSEMLSWAQNICQLVECRNIIHPEFKIKFIKFKNMNFDIMNDGKTFKLVMVFKIKVEVFYNDESQSLIYAAQN